jgi:hypothetical protein
MVAQFILIETDDSAQGPLAGKCSECPDVRFEADRERWVARDLIGQNASLKAQFDLHVGQRHIHDRKMQEEIADLKSRAGGVLDAPVPDLPDDDF